MTCATTKTAFLHGAALAALLAACTNEPGVTPAGAMGGPGRDGSAPVTLPRADAAPLRPGAGGGGGTGGGAAAPDGSAAPGEAANCGLQRHRLEKVAPELLLVVDRSDSMNKSVPGAGTSRWSEATTAIREVLMRTSNTVSWGLKMFPTGMKCGVTDGVEIPVGTGNVDAVMNGINGNKPGAPVDGTPTGLVIQRAAAYLKSRASTHPRFILLVTDGEPSCGAMPDDEAIAAVTSARADGFPTFVVGIGTGMTTAEGMLNALAIVGGQPRPGPTGAARYYPVANRAELASALVQITTQVSNCVFPLEKQPPSPDDVGVKVDGVLVPRDRGQGYGWSYGAGMRSVELHGPVCERLKAGQVMDVAIVFGCPGAVIE